MHERTDEYYMTLALQEAERALQADEVPVGAVIVHEGRVIARAGNQRETLQDPTAHAEMIAITQAATYLRSWRLLHTTLYVTLEPCAMCAGAIVLARIPTLVYGAKDPKAGACGSVLDVTGCPALNHRTTIREGVLSGEAAALLQDFFAARRGR